MGERDMLKKVIFFALAQACVFFIAPLGAEVKNVLGYELRLKASKDGSEYTQGEQAEFVLTVKKDGKLVSEPIAVSAEITKDSVPMGLRSNGTLKNGCYKVSGTLKEPGFLKCQMKLTLADSEGAKESVDMLAGAAFDPLQIKPSMPVPDDFDAYWNEQKKILAAIPMNLRLTRIDSGVKGVDMYDVQADSFNGGLSAYMALPSGAGEKSLPAVVFTHGAGVRSSGRGVIGAAKRGFIALDFNAHGLPNGKPAEFYKQHADGDLKGYTTRGALDRDKIFFRTLYMRLMRAMDVIMSQKQWNGKDLMVSGGSQGGGQALAAAGLYPDKVSVCVSMFPAICDHTGPVIGRTSGWPHYTRLDSAGRYDKTKVNAPRYIDAVNFASRVKCRTFFMINYADNVCEPTSCYAAYNAISAPKSLYINEESRHSPAPGTYNELQNQAYDFVLKGGK